MPSLSEDWTPIANTLGYKDEVEMLQDLYVTQGFSVEDLAKRLGYSKNNVRRRLLFNDIPLRGRGGRNNLGKGYLANVPDDELKDVRKAAANHSVHLSTVFKELKRRRECNSVQSSQLQASTPSAEDELLTLPSPSTSERKPPTESSSDSNSSKDMT